MAAVNKGITLAGNMIVDVVKNIDCYPDLGMLSHITSVSRAVGGCVPNTAIDLAKIDGAIPLSVIGKVGNDEYGRYVISQLQAHNICCEKVIVSADAPTSFSDVMNLPSGERTFFHCPGANAMFSPEDVDIASIPGCILHVGYLLLLELFDKEDPECGTAMARFLRDVQAQGIKTSVDVVSSSTLDFASIIKPALRYCDYIIFNEIECCSIWGIKPYKGSVPDIDAIRKAMELTMNEGVREKVIVHCKQAGFCLSRSGEFTVVPSLKIPPECIKGSVGAGDAFCAGSLYGIYNGWEDRDILAFASAAAACNLFSENSVDGMLDKAGVLETESKYSRIVL